MSNRHGQKGVISLIVDDDNMPIIENSNDKIDLIMNPHTFPTRKTLGQLLEMGNKTYNLKLNNKNIKEPIIVDDITHQANSGKSRNGGLRFGHMERDIMLAVGAHKELENLWSIDKIK